MNSFKNKFVLARGPAGIYAGVLKEEKGGEVVLADAFCLWYWKGAASLLQLVTDGVSKPDECKFSVAIPLVKLKEVFQIMPISTKAETSLKGVTKWKF